MGTSHACFSPRFRTLSSPSIALTGETARRSPAGARRSFPVSERPSAGIRLHYPSLKRDHRHWRAGVAETLDGLGRSIADGDPEARATLEKLQAMQRDDPDEAVRAAARQAVRSIEAGTQLFGLRGELTKIAAVRASWRKETLRRLIHESEVTP